MVVGSLCIQMLPASEMENVRIDINKRLAHARIEAPIVDKKPVQIAVESKQVEETTTLRQQPEIEGWPLEQRSLPARTSPRQTNFTPRFRSRYTTKASRGQGPVESKQQASVVDTNKLSQPASLCTV
jgi:hypothetical protein